MSNTRRVVSPWPVCCIGATWLLWAFLFPLYKPLHFVAAAVVSALVYLLTRSFVWKDRTIVLPDPPKEEKKEEAKKPQTEEEKALAELKGERDKALSEMRRLNDAIADPKISAQIDHLEDVTGKIFGVVAEKPAKRPQIRKFLQYYLPTTLKILNAYDRMGGAGIEGENISTTKDKIEGMMDTITTAFDKQLDALYGEEALDISTDITVMEQMLAREGIGGTQIGQDGTQGIRLE